MNNGGLFGGIGGLELGFEMQGYTTKWFVERDPYAAEILKKRFPNAIIYGDIKDIDWKSVPKVDCLTGGFPCQDISNAGQRDGIEGSRSSLWKDYLKAIVFLQPRFALIENVSALLGRGLDVVLCDLAEVGYDAEWHCISASSVGANHQRDRIFILAYPDSSREEQNSRAVESTSEGVRREKTSDVSVGCSSAQVCGSLADSEGIRFDRGRSFQDVSNQKREFLHNKKTIRNKIWCEASGCCQDVREVSNSESIRVQGLWSEGKQEPEAYVGQDVSVCSCEGESTNWATEPDVGRVANGVPFRVDRIKCLGNAVVPQVAEVFAEAIKKRCEQ